MIKIEVTNFQILTLVSACSILGIGLLVTYIGETRNIDLSYGYEEDIELC